MSAPEISTVSVSPSLGTWGDRYEAALGALCAAANEWGAPIKGDTDIGARLTELQRSACEYTDALRSAP